jgi:hypothetical protein
MRRISSGVIGPSSTRRARVISADPWKIFDHPPQGGSSGVLGRDGREVPIGPPLLLVSHVSFGLEHLEDLQDGRVSRLVVQLLPHLGDLPS